MFVINFKKYKLNNGLTVILNPDLSSKMIAVCVLYKVGSKHEDSKQTGIAHLFEHLMFNNLGDGVDFDALMQEAGGDSNAFTTPDTTQYFCVLPKEQAEIALCLEAERMREFRVTKKHFQIQKNVVLEEFSENYLNNPYGIFTHKIMALSYKRHPYRWPVIGMDVEQIKALKFAHAEDFYNKFYKPNNAILVVSGNMDESEIMDWVESYFGSIPSGKTYLVQYDQELQQTQPREEFISDNFPEDALYLSFLSPARLDHGFYTCDILTDLLSEGKSSRLYNSLKKEKMLFTSIDCYMTATFDPGLVIFEGKLNEGVSIEQAEEGIWGEIDKLKSGNVSDTEWLKCINRNESTHLFSQIGVLNQSLNLSYAEFLGDPNLVNTELEAYHRVTREDVCNLANDMFREEAVNKLVFRAKT